jgi:VIT1/CCC1 family predicted Fe2+/Mn2+ transporter
MAWAQWTLLVLTLVSLGINGYTAGKAEDASKGWAAVIATVVTLVLYYFAGALDCIL